MSTLTHTPALSGGGTVRPSLNGRGPRMAKSSDRDHCSGKDTPCFCSSLETHAYLWRQAHQRGPRQELRGLPFIDTFSSSRLLDWPPTYQSVSTTLCHSPPVPPSSAVPRWGEANVGPVGRSKPKYHSHVNSRQASVTSSFHRGPGRSRQSPVASPSSNSGKLKPYLFPDVRSSL